MAIADIARKLESSANSFAAKRARNRGWVPSVTGYSGYGSMDVAHVLGRVLLEDPNRRPEETWAQRGYRQFFTIEVADIPVTVKLGATTVDSHADSQGYIDVRIEDHGLDAGWHEATIDVQGGQTVIAPVLIVSAETTVGFVSDIDDTVLVTWLPRAWTAAWNSWVRKTNNRKPVEGMSSFYQALHEKHPGAPVIYLSTGAWNTYETLTDFLASHGFPAGPMLLTDWGPTPTGLFRNGTEHKKVALRNLFLTYPGVEWILIGDDGQHDPRTYVDAAVEHPDHVRGIAIRNLSPEEQLLAHGTLAPLVEVNSSASRTNIPVIQGTNGYELEAQLEQFVNEAE
ncbi:ABC transporter ATPase [Corynebacterium phocae]|uniref:ABC transporter ATPase n=1 Tax=Corynebacterium phocae TaxID=161895 RepID=A0A1L7D3V0_9CORY|nr:phosphatase domain-containing protein [Corynebacterium phocae]APT92602.1 ABC transporter ATPase [Corynebacterium phocae]KAA8724157.1 DUF2183 domain-containing protein [Corynebacterium phocae]